MSTKKVCACDADPRINPGDCPGELPESSERGGEVRGALSAREVWDAGPRVRVDTLCKGDEFTAIDGARYVYVRPDGALTGVHRVERTDGAGATSFAGCAEVLRPRRCACGQNHHLETCPGETPPCDSTIRSVAPAHSPNGRPF